MKIGWHVLAVRLLAMLFSLILTGCGDDSSVNEQGGITTANARVSDCGGFKDSLKRWAADDIMETVIWSYDAESGTLRVLDTAAILNCCGEHSITAQVSDTVITVSESDQEPKEGRCRCECSYDFAIDITGLTEGVYTLVVKRAIDDESRIVAESAINLTAQAGSIPVP